MALLFIVPTIVMIILGVKVLRAVEPSDGVSVPYRSQPSASSQMAGQAHEPESAPEPEPAPEQEPEPDSFEAATQLPVPQRPYPAAAIAETDGSALPGEPPETENGVNQSSGRGGSTGESMQSSLQVEGNRRAYQGNPYTGLPAAGAAVCH